MKQAFTVAAVLASLASAELKQFRSGSISTSEAFQFGRFVARMRAPTKMGTVSAFFTYWTGAGGEPDSSWAGLEGTDMEWNEIDFEVVPSL
mmetsp:Transcript_16074/g.20379  ORF Transcript_16074/g.20379 Transcript_16074/m.20379 type:complete len:91 (+) Transcript_16074:1-273(+)